MSAHAPRSWSVWLLLCLVALGASTQTNAPIDWERAKQLHRRAQSGDSLSANESAYLQRAVQERQGRGGAGAPGPSQTTPARSGIGVKPLTEMNAADAYKGESGGLYGRGRNEPPAALQAAAIKAAAAIQPRDREGRPAPDGKIVLASLGMSNTTQEFSTFMTLANADQEKSPRVVLVDGAQGGQDAAAWVDPQGGGRASPWAVLDNRLAAADVSAAQVQAVWIKQALKGPARLGEFPRHEKVLQDDLAAIMGSLKARFPNLKLVYLSSRIYAGYTSSPLNPEPYAFEGAFAVRGLILDQLAGDGQLTVGVAGDRTPLALWGPYLWGDGQTPRQADKLVWLREDLAGDGTHPSESGRRKVAEMLLRFFKTDPTTRTWFLRR